MEYFFNLFKKNKEKHTPYILRQRNNRPKKYGIKHYRSYIIPNYNFVYEKPQYRFLEKYDDSNNVFYGDIFKEENEYFQQERLNIKRLIEGKVYYNKNNSIIKNKLSKVININNKEYISNIIKIDMQRRWSLADIDTNNKFQIKDKKKFDLSRSQSINLPIEITLINRLKKRNLHSLINPITGEDTIYDKKQIKKSSPIPITKPFTSNVDNGTQYTTPYNSPKNIVNDPNIHRNIAKLNNLIIIDTKNINRDITTSELMEIRQLLASNYINKIYYVPYLEDRLSDNYNYNNYNQHYKGHINSHIMFRYKILESIGKGCYGTVFKAYDYKHNIECALKVIKSNSNYYKSFLKETEILVHLSKSHIRAFGEGLYIRVLYSELLKTFVWRGHGVIAMKLYNKNLYASKLGKLGKSELKVILTDIFEALIFLKYANVLHLDLKPENIFFINNTTFNVVIGDFGLAKISDRKISNEFYVQTCWYRSPEVVCRIPYSFEADLWSVGTIMIELLINNAIFKCKEEEELYIGLVLFLGKKPNIINNNNKIMLDNMLDVSVQKKIQIKKHIDIVKQLIKDNEFPEIRELIDGILKWIPEERISLEKCKKIVESF